MLFPFVKDCIKKLSEDRQVFHSEADFQHALAWKIREEDKDLEIRLEKGVPIDGGFKHIDIWLTKTETKTKRKINFLIELKYKKKKFYHESKKGEIFNLPTQGARDSGCFDFFNDVLRIEKLIQQNKDTWGAAIFLTNENLYMDGTLPGYKGSRAEEIKLSGSYILKWKPYSEVGDKKKTNRTFKWLGIKVSPNSTK